MYQGSVRGFLQLVIDLSLDYYSLKVCGIILERGFYSSRRLRIFEFLGIIIKNTPKPNAIFMCDSIKYTVHMHILEA